MRIENRFLLKGRKVIDKNGIENDSSINNMVLHKNIPKGAVAQRDTTCDSKFMLETVHEIGMSIRRAYEFVNKNQVIYLIIDNAGGHGTTGTKEEYERILLQSYKVQVIWQVPNSPETNMLDLGAWMSVQSQVEEEHRNKVMQNDVLAQSVESAFQNLSQTVLTNTYNRWKLNPELILKDEGDNKLVEKCRNKGDNIEDLVHIDEHKMIKIVVIENTTDKENESDRNDDNGSKDE